MKRITIYAFNRLALFLVISLLLSCSNKYDNDFSARVKIALRDVGNKLLLSKNDSTSLILPIIEIETNYYKIEFSNPFSFDPDSLVSIIKQSFKTSQLPHYYRVEVLQCSDREVAYSYQMSADQESTIIPCSGRYLPKACYIIEVKLKGNVYKSGMLRVIIYTLIVLILLGVSFYLFKKERPRKIKHDSDSFEKLGSFYFYPEQNKLIMEAKEIALSKKECELLTLFVANPNQIIKRDELTKRVWEDNGVFVGRSLDTYISKLRKKLKEDTSIKITNVHGVGYKLELS